MDSKKKENNDNLIIKTLYKKIREGCQRKICYNIYCNNNLICRKSMQIITINILLYFIS